MNDESLAETLAHSCAFSTLYAPFPVASRLGGRDNGGMSRFPYTSSRGASVLAALVLAAFLASIAMLVQEGSPIAYTNSQTAAGGNPALATPTAQPAVTASASQPQQKPASTTDCNAAPNLGYDIKLHADGTLEKVAVCTMHHLRSSNAGTKKYPSQPTAADFGSAAGRCIGTSSTLPSSDWRCVIATCKLQTQSVGRAAYNQETCQYAYNDKGPASKDSPVSGGPSSSAPVQGDPNVGEQANPKETGSLEKETGSLQQEAFKRAFEEQKKAIEEKVNSLNDDYAKNLEELAQSGCDASPTRKCTQINLVQSGIQDEIKRLTEQYNELNKLTPNTGEPCDSNHNCTVITKTQGPPPPNEQNPIPKDFPPYDPNYKNNSQTGFGQPPHQPGGSGGGGPQNGGQPQCQPRYFCNGNSVMYAQCYNLQQGNAQMVLQCQQGYSCQNNSCQPQAIYGYCADGRTPRMAPAQQQPPASSCTVGTWQDTSNGCQTSWQCVPSGGTTGGSAPTAQLSCEPLSAISGTTISFSYACAGGATDIVASGFSIAPTTLAGNATTTIQKPAGGNSVTYSLSCINKSISPATTASAQCTVQVGNASIVLVATPDRVSQSETDTVKKQVTIGWVTSGMQACTIANPDFVDWTNQQAANTSVAGAATSPVISTTTTFALTCTTLAGTTASSTVKVLSI